MAMAAIPQNPAHVLIQFDQMDMENFSGRLYNPYLPDAVGFHEVLELVRQMEKVFDTLSYPQPGVCYRHFFTDSNRKYNRKEGMPPSSRKQPWGKELLEDFLGREKAFLIQVRTRQNATWQGTITCCGSGETRIFNSALELLRMLGKQEVPFLKAEK